MSGRWSRDKGARAERAIVRLLQRQGIVAEKISGMYKPGADLRVSLMAVDRASRSNGAPTASANSTIGSISATC
jgi:hypothetical protein